QVPTGTYNLHVDIDGFREVRQPLDVMDGSVAIGSNIIQMIPAPGRLSATSSRSPVTRGGRNAVDVSEIVEQYPHKAVDLFEKAQASRHKGKMDQAISQ